jgi:hypothetical protein
LCLIRTNTDSFKKKNPKPSLDICDNPVKS